MKRIWLSFGAILIVLLSLIPINALVANGVAVSYTYHQINMSGVYNSDAYTPGENYTTGTYYPVNPGTTYNDPVYGNVPMDMKTIGQPNVWLSHGASRTGTFLQEMTLSTNVQNAVAIWLVGFDGGWVYDGAPVLVKYKLDGVDYQNNYSPNDWGYKGTGPGLVLWVDIAATSVWGDIAVARIDLPHAGNLTEIKVIDPDTDNSGALFVGASFPIFTVTVAEAVIPVVDAGSGATINEGDTFASSGSFTDPDSNSWTATVDYGDGSGVQPLVLASDKTFVLSHVYADNDIYTVTVAVTDDYGSTGSDTATVTVLNVVPLVNAGLDATINEGSTFNSSGSFTDPGADTWTATVDYGDGSGAQPLTLAGKTFSLSHVYADNGTYTVTVTVTDDDGGIGTDTATITVNNVAPIVNAGSDATINEGSTFNSSGSFTDPGADTWTATVNYGDGSGVQALTLTGKTFSLSHVYADNGTYAVTVTVTDDDDGIGTDTAIVTVLNVVPVVNAGIDQEVYAGDTVSFAGTFTDPGWLDTHTAVWNFGDGHSGAGTLNEENNPPDSTGTVTGSHIFYEKGTYTVTLSVTDKDVGVGTDTLIVNVLAIPAIVDFVPNTLNLKSEGKWVTVFIEFPIGPDGQDWDINMIDANSVRLNGVVSAVTDPKYGFVKNSATGDNNGDRNPRLMLKFDRNLVQDTLQVGENVEIRITGKVMFNGGPADFEGTDSIRVINNGSEKSNNNHEAIGNDTAPGQNKEPGDNADGKAVGNDTAPGQNKEPGDNADGKAVGNDTAPGQNKEPGDNADGKAVGNDTAPGQNKEPKV